MWYYGSPQDWDRWLFRAADRRNNGDGWARIIALGRDGNIY